MSVAVDWSHELREISRDLTVALATFDRVEAGAVVERWVETLRTTAEPCPAAEAVPILRELRDHRRFDLLLEAAAALSESGADDALITSLYAQALMDTGRANEASSILNQLVGTSQRLEALGQLGRLHKQLYVDAARAGGRAPPAESIRRSIHAYRQGFEEAENKLWHGVNLLATIARARADGITGPGIDGEDVTQLAATLLTAADAGQDIWSKAVRLEIAVARGDWPSALEAAKEYVGSGSGSAGYARAFEIASTLRQLEEVWRVPGDGEGVAPRVIALLRAAVVARTGGTVVIPARQGALRLEANFDREPRLRLQWWQLALERTRAIGQVRTAAGRPHGTGFLVDPTYFFEHHTRIDGPLFLTNEHVISPDGAVPGSIPPEGAVVYFEATGHTARVRKLIAAFEDPLDAAFVTLDRFDAPAPVPVASAAFDDRRRLYVIGYPLGETLSFSIHDSAWLDRDATTFHYRTPTEPGSSGSPVFEDREWNAVALHYANHEKAPRLNGKYGTYQANLGSSLEAIADASRRVPIEGGGGPTGRA